MIRIRQRPLRSLIASAATLFAGGFGVSCDRSAPSPATPTAPPGPTLAAPAPSVSPAATPAAPASRVRVTEDGVNIASFDAAALAVFCKARDLPQLPPLDNLEPAVADTLEQALTRAARQRNGDAIGRVGMILYSLEMYRSARSYFELAEQKASHNDRWSYYIACLCQLEGQPEEATRRLEAIVRRSASYGMVFARLGQLYLDAGRVDDALGAAEQYLRFAPKDSLGYIMRGRVAMARADWPAAKKHLTEALQFPGPNDFQTRSYLARTYAALGDVEAAKREGEAARRLPPGEYFGFRDAWYQEMLRSCGSVVMAIQDALKLADAAHDLPRQIELCKRLLRFRGDDIPTMIRLADGLRQADQLDESRAVIDRGLKRRPDSAGLICALARLELAKNDPAAARKAAEQALKLATRQEASREAREVLVQAALAAKDPAAAEAAIQPLLAEAPHHPMAHYLAGEVHRAAHRIADAGAAYQRAVELDPQFAAARTRLDELRKAQPSRP